MKSANTSKFSTSTYLVGLVLGAYIVTAQVVTASPKVMEPEGTPSSETQKIKIYDEVLPVTNVGQWKDGFYERASDAFDKGLVNTVDSPFVECFETEEIRGAYICAFLHQLNMNKALIRASIYVEGIDGAEKNQIVTLDDRTYKQYLRDAGGHDLRSEDLLKFWEDLKITCEIHTRFSDGDNWCPTPMEQLFFDKFVLEVQKKKASFVLITFSLDNVNMTYSEVVSHEILHAQFFLTPKYEETVENFWNTKVSEEDKKYIGNTLESEGGYDTSLHILLINEFQAYILMNNAYDYMLNYWVQKYRDDLNHDLALVSIYPLQVD